jgi:hypothetical protein
MTRLLIHLSSSDLLHRPDATSPMWFSTWEDLMRARVVAPAMTRRGDELCYVMYLCHKMMTMYCCVKTTWIIIDLCIELELSLFCCVNLLYVTCFGGSPSGEAATIGIIYIRKIQYIPQLTEEHMALYSSVNRGIYGHMTGARGGGIIFVSYV